MSDDPRRHVVDARLGVAVSLFGSFLLAGLLSRAAGPFAYALVPAGIAAAVVIAVRGISGGRAANRRMLDARFGVLGLTPEPYGPPGGLRYRGVFAGRHVEAYQLRAELYVAVSAGTRSFVVFSGPQRALGESVAWPAMPEVPTALGLPPGVTVTAQDPAAVGRLLADPHVPSIVVGWFRAARDPRWRRVWIGPGGAYLRDLGAFTPDPETARSTVEQLVHLAAAAERAGL